MFELTLLCKSKLLLAHKGNWHEVARWLKHLNESMGECQLRMWVVQDRRGSIEYAIRPTCIRRGRVSGPGAALALIDRRTHGTQYSDLLSAFGN